MEKHDIPIVVGVGVSLAFIFMTVFFYSVVQKNQPVPPNRAGWRSTATCVVRMHILIVIIHIRPKQQTFQMSYLVSEMLYPQNSQLGIGCAFKGNLM